MKRTSVRLAGVFFLGALVSGAVLSLLSVPAESERAAPAASEPAVAGEPQTEAEQLYMCPMMCVDPQPEPGRCPVCGMDLVPMPEESGAAGAGPQLSMSEASRKLAEVRTSTVTRRFARMELRLTGKVDYDETRVREITAWVSGRLESLFVDQTGTRVRNGDPLVEIYSRELNAEKATYLATIQGDRSVYGPEAVEQPERWLRSVRARLRLRGLTTEQIKALEDRESPSYTDRILSPIEGTVIRKSAMEGMHVEKGTHLYTLADLSRVWVWLDAYESDLPFLRYGQEVAIRTESYGDRVFRGWVSFIEPVLDEATRTTRVRVVVENEDGDLKPNMFVRARVRVRVGAEGEVIPGENLAGMWISPRHPEIVRDEPGECPVCGIDLVRAGDLGYGAPETSSPPLLVPASAVLYTGTRSLVYVRVPQTEEPTFEGRTVRLGPRVGEDYVVLEGLSEGEEVAARGAFKIDSALQLVGKPSMMRPAGGSPGGGHAHHGHAHAQEPVSHDHSAHAVVQEVEADLSTAAGAALAEAMEAYFATQVALGKDSSPGAGKAAASLQERLLAVPVDAFDDSLAEHWAEHGIGAYKAAARVEKADALPVQREAFVDVSEHLEAVLRQTGPLPGLTVYRVFCPMAFGNEGGYWLQKTDEVLNPYEGSRMPRCGTVEETLWEAAQ
jgi:Cu(I)/Ag(I) efflux system membrane fusion protein